MLQLLFGLNGLSLSLLTLPIMYILNTRVAVPLPYLPAYGAIAFLPYSLKPMYAFLCGIWVTRFSSDRASPRSNANSNDAVAMEGSIRNNQSNNKHHHDRYLSLFRWLLATNSIVTLLFLCIPKGGVLAIFVVAFLRGISDSWAEFCLGLTLIDHARANAALQYEATVSSLQAQAATAGNLGAWLGSLLICVVLLWRRVASSHEEDQPQLTWALANGLVISTVLIQLVGVAAVYVWETKQNHNIGSSNDVIYEEIPMQARISVDNAIPTESDSLRDEESSHPSYSSLEDLSDEEEDGSSLSTEGSGLIRNSSSNNDRSVSPKRIANWAIVILLQCVLVAIALKGPIVEVSSHFVWVTLVWAFLAGIFIASITLCCKFGNEQPNVTGNDLTTFKVGLFLVLKNAIPSEAAILASFFYSLFGINQPLLMQFLSFLGMGVSSLSSWSYTRLFSTRFGSGRPLVVLMAGTTALASLASLLHIGVFRIYQADDESDADDNSLPSRKLLLMAILSKFVTTFFDEWAFLPELVLATTSVKVPTSEEVNATETGIMSDGAIVSNTPNHQDSNTNTSSTNISDEDDQQRIAMEYGTLVSCIDFGDQLGSLLAAPLVAMWQISRENGFLHLDRLIVFCSVANITITIGLLPLLWNIGSKSKR